MISLWVVVMKRGFKGIRGGPAVEGETKHPKAENAQCWGP